MASYVKECLSSFLQLLRVFWQLLWGIQRVLWLPRPIISIFGGAKFSQDNFYAKQAHILAKRLTENDISVLTGGGPGIMQAASCGGIARSKGKGRVMGINVRDLDEPKNPCVEDYFEMDYFFARKWLLTHYSAAFIVFPGGFGTLDELAEVLTLIQTKRLLPEPIVLVGVEYWTPFMHWLEHEVLKHGAVKREDLNLFTVTDDFEEIYCIIRDQCVVRPWIDDDQKNSPQDTQTKNNQEKE